LCSRNVLNSFYTFQGRDALTLSPVLITFRNGADLKPENQKAHTKGKKTNMVLYNFALYKYKVTS